MNHYEYQLHAITNNNLSIDTMPLGKFNEGSIRLTSTRNIQDLKKNTGKTVSVGSGLCFPTFNLSETLHFILTRSYNQPPIQSVLNFVIYYV
jgi:hypothetical protein